MDPFIEGCGLWADFHNHLVEKVSEQLASAAPERYFVRTGERFYVVVMGTNGKDSHPFLPDVSVTTPRRRKKATKNAGAAVAELPSEIEPVTLRAFIDEEHRERFIEIYEEEPDKRLVTCIEVLSPSNKRPGTEGWELYQRKRQSILLGNVNLVEIDLLRGGQRMPMLDPWPESPYVIMVARAMHPQRCKVWRTYFHRPLPSIPVPLAKPDPAIPLDLQLLVNGIYDRYRYARSIDYTKILTPPLSPEDADWLNQQLRARAKPQKR
jgi:hypothetical protein